MKINICLELCDIMQKPVDDWNESDMSTMDDLKKQPGNIVKLDKEDSMMDPGTNSEPLEYTVQPEDTLKSIATKFGISYGELSMHLMNTEGSTSIHVGQEIEIPRHFKDLSKAK